MKIFTYPSATSTSDVAKELLNTGQNPPFAVHAFEQSSGRGQNRHTWQSPIGGVYVSLALPASLPVLSVAPLHAALILAEWIETLIPETVVIKWPNDILVHGRKLAGILCESSMQGGEAGPLIVGIGVNVAPVASEPFAISMSQLGFVFDEVPCVLQGHQEKLVSSLASHFENHWVRPFDYLHPRFHPRDWLWWDETLGFMHHRGITKEGFLRISKNPHDPLPMLIASSGQYRLQWTGQVSCPQKEDSL